MNENETPDAGEADLSDLVRLVTGLNRFLTHLSDMPQFREVNIGLAEWAALSIIADGRNVHRGLLSKRIGVSPQRANQIVERLKTLSLVAGARETKGRRLEFLSITPAGTATLRQFDAKLGPKIKTALGKRPHAIAAGSRLINGILMRIVTSR